MKKTITLLLVIGAILIGSSMVSLMAEPVQTPKTRKIVAGTASLQVPLHLPKDVANGTPDSGSVLMGSREECDITYDSFTGIYWSERIIPGSALLPTPAYDLVSEQTGEALDLGRGEKALTRTIKLSAEKPCGTIVQETLNVIDLYCRSSKTHYAIVGMQDPFMTQERLAEIAKSLKCT